MNWFLGTLMIAVIASLVLNGTAEFARGRMAARTRETYRFAFGRILWSKASTIIAIVVLLVMGFRLGSIVSQNVRARHQPLWAQHEEIYQNPPNFTGIYPSGQLPNDWDAVLNEVQKNGTSEQIAWVNSLNNKRVWLKKLYPKFTPERARDVDRAMKFLPVLSWLGTFLLVTFLYGRVGRGKREMLGGIQVLLLIYIFFILCGSRLADALPEWLALSYGFLAKMYGFETAKAQALFAVLIAIVAMTVRLATKSRGLAFITWIALGLAVANLIVFVAPSMVNTKIKDQWGRMYDNPLTLATVQEEKSAFRPVTGSGTLPPGTPIKSYLVSFDTKQPSPHLTGISISHTQRVVIQRATKLEKPHQYFRTREGKVHWATVAGDSLNGQCLMPINFRHPDWFCIRGGPAGALIMKIGTSDWFAPFMNGDMFVGTGVEGEVLVDINDTRRRSNNDGMQYYADNDGVVYCILRVFEPPGRALLAGP